jgi:large subunit ribosomal protein L2
MPIKKFKPVTPGSRFRAVSDLEEVTRKGPEKSLTEPLHKTGGRNHHGRITTRRRGGGAQRRFRGLGIRGGKHRLPGPGGRID